MERRAELRRHWRALAAATIGLGSGMGLSYYVNSLFAPYLLRAFGWTKAEFALLGVTGVLTILCIPVAGRLTDLFGVRRVALIGVIGYPASLVALSLMDGRIGLFVVLMLLQVPLGVSTTTVCYCRLIAERFVAARGFALALAAMGPAVVGGLGSLALAAFIDAHGWRAGYRALAAYSLLFGLAALALAPSSRAVPHGGAARRRRTNAADYRLILANPAFRIIFVGTFLCSLPLALAATQLSVMLQDRALSASLRGLGITLFAGGTLVGRLLLGPALDRFPTYRVAVVGMGASGVGMLLLAVPGDVAAVVLLGIGLLGFSFGAEADVVAYAAARYFPVALYSSVLGLFSGVVGVAAASSSILLSTTLHRTGSFTLYLIAVGVAVVLGSLIFLRLRHLPAEPAPA